METIDAFIRQLTRMQLSDYVDIALVTLLVYKALPLLRSTGTARVAKVVVALMVITWLSGALQLKTFNFLMSQVAEIGLIAIVVLFQPELRRMLDHLGSVKLKGFFGLSKQTAEMDPDITSTVNACEVMSRQKIGALIVFARNQSLDEFFKTGTPVDAQVSDQLIRNIFFPNAALHDGAMIIRDGRIAAAGCVLPLSESDRLSADLGTRHRAGVGMSEVSDAVVVICSEETGAISVAIGGMLKRHLAPQTLERLLRNELCKDEEAQKAPLNVRLRQKLHMKGKDEDEDEA